MNLLYFLKMEFNNVSCQNICIPYMDTDQECYFFYYLEEYCSLSVLKDRFRLFLLFKQKYFDFNEKGEVIYPLYSSYDYSQLIKKISKCLNPPQSLQFLFEE